jgi:hypothetical protein
MEIRIEEEKLLILPDRDKSNKGMSEKSKKDNGARAIADFLRTELTPAGLYFELICETKHKEFRVEISNKKKERQITFPIKVVEDDMILIDKNGFGDYQEVDNYTSKVKFFWIAIASIL